MTFSEQLLSTLIGSFFGFMGSLTLFWIKEYRTRKSKITDLLSNLGYELDYNISLYEKWIDEITKCIEAVSANSRQTFLNIDYQYIARFFALKFYQSGSIQNYLHYKDMKRWNDFLLNLNFGCQNYVLSQLDKWRKDEISKEDIFQALKLERTHIQNALEMTIYIKDRLKT